MKQPEPGIQSFPTWIRNKRRALIEKVYWGFEPCAIKM